MDNRSSSGMPSSAAPVGYGGTIPSGAELPVNRMHASFTVEGANAIKALTPLPRGQIITLYFLGAASFINSSQLICPGAADVTFATGDAGLVRSQGDGVWRLLRRFPAASDFAVTGANVFSGAQTIANIIGGSAAASALNLQSTSGVGTSDVVNVNIGNNGSVNAGKFSQTLTSFQNSAQFKFNVSGGSTQPLWDFVDNNAWAGSGGAMRFFGLDSGSNLRLGAIINAGLADKTAGAFKGDIDFVVYGPSSAVQAQVALSGLYGGFVPAADNVYELGDLTLRWSSVNAMALNINTSTSLGAPVSIGFNSSTSQGISLQTNNSSIAGAPLLFKNSAGTACGSISFGAGQTSVLFNTTSDKRLKTDERDLNDPAAVIMQTKIWDFMWKSSGKRSVGVFAQDAYAVCPDAITPPKNEEDPWQADYSKYVPYLIAHNQSLERRLAALETRSA